MHSAHTHARTYHLKQSSKLISHVENEKFGNFGDTKYHLNMIYGIYGYCMYVCAMQKAFSRQFWANKTIKTMFVTMNDSILYKSVYGMGSCKWQSSTKWLKETQASNVSLHKSSDAIHICLGRYMNDRQRENMTNKHIRGNEIIYLRWMKSFNGNRIDIFRRPADIELCCSPRMGKNNRSNKHRATDNKIQHTNWMYHFFRVYFWAHSI